MNTLDIDVRGLQIRGLLVSRDAAVTSAERLIRIMETRDLTDSERKELDDLTAQVRDHGEQIRTLTEKCSTDDVDDDDPAMDEENPSPRSSRWVRPTPSRSKRSLPAGFDRTFSAHTTEHKYSLARAVRECVSGRQPRGLEGELSQECERRNERAPRGMGFFMPFNAMETRSGESTTTTMSGGVTTTWSDDFLVLLRRQSILEKLGIQIVSGVKGLYRIPFETSGNDAAWTAETGTIAANSMNVSYVQAQPRLLVGRYVLTRQMIASSQYNLLDDVMYKDLVNSTAEQVSLALVAGNQAATPTSPQGIIYNINVSQTALASPPTMAWNDVLGMQTVVANANPPAGVERKFLISPLGAQILRNRPRIDTGATLYPSFVLESFGADNNVMAGDGAVISTCIPDNIHASGVSGTETTMIYGAFGEAVRHVVYGDNVELLIDPYSLSPQGDIQIFTYLLNDFVIPRPSLLTVAYYQ